MIHATLTGTKVTDADVAALEALTDLTTLTLRGANINGEGLDRLAGMPKLGILFLDNTEVTDMLLDHLTKMTNLAFLSINNSKITIPGLDRLTMMTNLRVLRLWEARITGEEAVHPKAPGKLMDMQVNRCVVTDALLDYLRRWTNCSSSPSMTPRSPTPTCPASKISRTCGISA